jgi:hypothetical protein
MRRLQVDRRDQARRARMLRWPPVDLDEAISLDDRAAEIRAAAWQVTQQAARFLSRDETP